MNFETCYIHSQVSIHQLKDQITETTYLKVIRYKWVFLKVKFILISEEKFIENCDKPKRSWSVPLRIFLCNSTMCTDCAVITLWDPLRDSTWLI